MDTDRIDIFHITYGNTVSCTVAHNFVLDFFPAADTSFYQNLSDTGKTQTVFQNALKLCQIMCDTTAGTAQCIGRTQYDRIADLIGKIHTILNILNKKRRCTRLTDTLHQIFKFLSALCITDCFCGRTEKRYTVAVQKA